MAGHEDKTEEIVSDPLFARCIHIDGFLISASVPTYLLVFAFERLAAPDQVDSAVSRGSHQPCARPLRHPFRGPLFERGDQGVLCELLGGPYVANDASQPSDEPGRLDPPDRFDRPMRFGDSGLAATSTGGSVSLS